MAVMHPATLPGDILDDRMRSSEVQVYRALEQQLNDQFHVFYSSPWFGTNADGSEIDGEADFIIAEPQLGLLVIEVKGGRISIDENGQWLSKDRYGITRDIKNPVAQARSSKHQMVDRLKQCPAMAGRFIRARHAVILPHVGGLQHPPRPDMPLKIFAFDNDMQTLGQWVSDRLAPAADERVDDLGAEGVEALVRMLAKPIEMPTRLVSRVRQDLADIRLKTREQVAVLQELEVNRRMAISGAAGTGKTVLAGEKALLSAERGMHTLLLCFNRALAENLKRQFAGVANISVFSFLQYCWHVAQVAGADMTEPDPEVMASRLVEHFAGAGLSEFDAIIIDEGQDFQESWFQSLEVLLKHGANGTLYIFYDSNQNVMGRHGEYIERLPQARWSLTRNMRNTRHICRYTTAFYSGVHVTANGPEGQPAVLHPVTGHSDLVTALSGRIGQLTKVEGISLSEIAVLCESLEVAEALSSGSRVGLGKLAPGRAEQLDSDRLIIDSISRFKGLERPVVLLVLPSSRRQYAELLYTGVSRAQCLLEVFGRPEQLRHLKQYHGWEGVLSR